MKGLQNQHEWSIKNCSNLILMKIVIVCSVTEKDPTQLLKKIAEKDPRSVFGQMWAVSLLGPMKYGKALTFKLFF